MSAALLGAMTMARLCHELQVDFEVALFNRGFAARPDDTEWSYTRTSSQAAAGLRQTHGTAANRLTTTVNHYLVKPFDRRWREAEDVLAGMFWTAAEPGKAAIAARRNPRTAPPVSMFERAANVDEFNLIHAAERMARLGANVRVLVVLADGMTRGSVEALATSVQAVERSGTTVLGIGIGDDTVSGTYHRFEVVNRPEELDQGDDRRNPRSAAPGSRPLGHGHLVACGPPEPATASHGRTRLVPEKQPTNGRDQSSDSRTRSEPENPSSGKVQVPDDVPDRDQRIGKIPTPDPHYIDLGMLYRFAQVEAVRRAQPEGFSPLHLAVRGHMGTGKDHDIEQFAARLGLPYYRIPLTGEVRDVTLIGSTRLHGDGKGRDREPVGRRRHHPRPAGPGAAQPVRTRMPRAPRPYSPFTVCSTVTGRSTSPPAKPFACAMTCACFGTMNPTDIRDYAGTQTLNKAFADRWVIWEKEFPGGDQVQAMLTRRYPSLATPYVEAISATGG